MSTSNAREPRIETSREVEEVKDLGAKHDLLRQYWNGRYGETYENVLEGVTEFGRHGVIAEYIQRLVRRGNVLDAGCGTGILSELIDPTRFHYFGVDISDHAIRFAREHRSRPNAMFVESPIEQYTPAGRMNAVVLNEVLYYLDTQRVIERLHGFLEEPRIVISSIFDFPEGVPVIHYLEEILSDSNTVVISNPSSDLKWTVVSGILH